MHPTHYRNHQPPAVPPAILPPVGFLVALIMILFLALTLVAWPLFACNDWRNGTLFKAGRYDGME